MHLTDIPDIHNHFPLIQGSFSSLGSRPRVTKVDLNELLDVYHFELVISESSCDPDPTISGTTRVQPNKSDGASY